jgi:protein-disulfide isomerase
VPPVPKPNSKRSTGAASRKHLIIAVAGAAVVVAALIAGNLLLGSGSSDSATPSGPGVSLTGIPQDGIVLGNPDAKVELSQYEDLQCPICTEYMVAAFPAIVDEYVKTGEVKVRFRGMEFLGPDSEKALRIALAAGNQDKLFEVVDLFYREQGDENSGWVTDEKIDEILAQVPGLDAAKVKADAQSAEVTSEIAAVKAEAADRGVTGTPTFFITIGKQTPYALAPTSLTPDAFRPALDDALRG